MFYHNSPTRIFILCVIIFLAAPAFAQETESVPDRKMSIGIGPEWNMNSVENFAGGAVLDFQYNLPRPFAVGLSVSASTNFDGFTVLEPAALFRWYVLGKTRGYRGLFAQADAGAFLVFNNSELTPMGMGGLRLGYRIPVGKSFYVEPYGRGGYPFVFGIGVMAGLRFKEEVWETNDFGVFRR